MLLFNNAVLFWIVIFYSLNLAYGVRCHICFDNAGDLHDPADCPLLSGVAANVAALAAGGVLCVTHLFHDYLVTFLGCETLDRMVRKGCC